jgi:transcriptional repressor NrdR
MKCPFCGNSQDRVLDTRVQKEGAQIRRRRECSQCKGRFSTLEAVLLDYPLIVKKDGRREEFNKAKVQGGIQAACQKRPVSLAKMEAIVDRVAQWALNMAEKEIAAQHIGQKVMQELRGIDDVAYVRFASVYRTFTDVQEFVETLGDEPEVNNSPQSIEEIQLPLTPLN